MNILEKMFLEILNLSLAGSFVIIAILLLRVLFRKISRKFSYILWVFAGFRLICPAVLPVFSKLFPVRQDTFIYENLAYENPQIQSGITAVDNNVSSFLQSVAGPAQNGNSVNPMQIYIALGSLLWLVVMVGMLVYHVGTYMVWRYMLSTAVKTDEKDIYETDKIGCPILFGIWKPIIYVPVKIRPEECKYAVAHERVHKRRYDNLVKLVAFGILILHWFNPLCWLAFCCMTMDMEISCDEAVIGTLAAEDRVNYGKAVVNETLKRSGYDTLLALGFGKGNTKMRVKSILNYRKQPVIISALCIFLLLTSGFVLLSGKQEKVVDELAGSYFISKQQGDSNALEKVKYQESTLQEDELDLTDLDKKELKRLKEQLERLLEEKQKTLEKAKQDIAVIRGQENRLKDKLTALQIKLAKEDVKDEVDVAKVILLKQQISELEAGIEAIIDGVKKDQR